MTQRPREQELERSLVSYAPLELSRGGTRGPERRMEEITEGRRRICANMTLSARYLRQHVHNGNCRDTNQGRRSITPMISTTRVSVSYHLLWTTSPAWCCVCSNPVSKQDRTGSPVGATRTASSITHKLPSATLGCPSPCFLRFSCVSLWVRCRDLSHACPGSVPVPYSRGKTPETGNVNASSQLTDCAPLPLPRISHLANPDPSSPPPRSTTTPEQWSP